MTSRFFNRLDPALVLAGAFGTALLWLLVDLARLRRLDDFYAESGGIETLSALYLMLGAVLLGAAMVVRRSWGDWHQPFLLLAASLRELDWDKAFTDSGILSLRHYSGNAPLAEKIAGAAVVLLLIAALLRLVWRDLPDWLRGLWRWKGAAWIVLLSLGLLVVAKGLDGLDRKLTPWGIELPRIALITTERAEESMEMLAAILLFQAVVLTVRRLR